ncbi:dienelactone hydrolase family protein [Rickettsiella massiliensis]|uniref:dienelactone hydrolase family protein n=1 Tax=Rickettsiella massiliensis TaxID=676517 RepID=UPI00029A92A8|nr:dienelactone hydrolase family protein [Rickettsiella massiliensis]
MSNPKSDSLPYIEVNPLRAPSASIICLHGLGGDGHYSAKMARTLALGMGIRFVFPHAPVRPITLNGGIPMRAWYDLHGFAFDSMEDESGIRAAEQSLLNLIDQEVARGIPAKRIILAGFSQGGAMALHTALRCAHSLGGILALSTYLPLHRCLAKEANPANKATPIFMAHGDQDDIVAPALGEYSYHCLKALAYPVEFNRYPIGHSMCSKELMDITQWLKKRLQK